MDMDESSFVRVKYKSLKRKRRRKSVILTEGMVS